MSNALVWLAILGICFSVSTLCWWGWRLIATVPDAQSRDRESPPVVFRLLWPLIRILAFYLGPVLTLPQLSQLQIRYGRRIVLAGYDYALKPADVLAAQLSYGVLFALSGSVVQVALELPFWLVLLAGGYGAAYPWLWLGQQASRRCKRFLRELPFFLDVVVLCVEGGITLNNAMQQAAQKGPQGPARQEFERTVRDMRSGMSRVDALRGMAERVDHVAIRHLVAAMIQAENLGMNLGPILRQQAEHRRTERFLLAEKLAMEAPVKMLLPLVAFIFPCTFIVIGFPIYVLMAEAFR